MWVKGQERGAYVSFDISCINIVMQQFVEFKISWLKRSHNAPTLLELKQIKVCHRYRAMSAQVHVQSYQAVFCWLTNINFRSWLSTNWQYQIWKVDKFKNFSMLRVNILTHMYNKKYSLQFNIKSNLWTRSPKGKTERGLYRQVDFIWWLLWFILSRQGSWSVAFFIYLKGGPLLRGGF